MKKLMMNLVACLLLFSCKDGKPPYLEVKDNELTIQAIQLEEAESNTGVSYKVRLIPNREMLKQINAEKQRALTYKMDSCFYISLNKQKIYPLLTQAIANGVSGSYEYLLEFETDKNESRDSIRLMYHDKYINNKIYSITSNQK
ncbi:hypothetical protein [Mucilaginibacter paludis]|uniref:Lipoprotein n=1 Tax=Mucilaginibacter paludis DSM 18603 TaxID=714943 RepID=H1YES5_9SPHI|nr:hypothetical protein [Mucilaginibacter paludis]EHQ24342.1 hypothetical protein Mucpa_0142 [Mucilaginibacter paludis DSM 18603]